MTSGPILPQMHCVFYSLGVSRSCLDYFHLKVSRDSLIALEYMWPRQQFRSPEPWQRWNAQAVLVGSLRMRAHRLLPTYFRVCREAASLLHKFEVSRASTGIAT